MKIYAKGTKEWDQAVSVNLSVNDIIKKYESGFAGTFLDPEQRELFTELSKKTGGYTDIEDAAKAFNWFGSFEGQLVVPYVHVMEALPGVWPGAAQGRGDCVSHSNKNTILGTMVCEVVSGQPDEATGMLETIPKISLEGIRNGGLSTEVSYWFRESDRDGWFCEASANVSMQYAGAVIRGPLEGTNIDLTKYTAELAGKYGSRKPPQEVINAINKNLIRTAARANTFDGIRDALGQGKFIHTCGMEGFAKSRNEHGLSRRSGSWAHAMGYIAVDDRPEIRAIYKEPLVLILNSWGKRWISGPRDILNSSKFVPENKKLKWIKCGIVNPNTGNLLIPEGSFWARWSEISGRNMTVFSGLNGWKMSKINNWGTDILG